MNVVQLIFVAVEAIGRYPHFTGWCPVHLDNIPGGRRSLRIDFADKGVGMIDAWFHCRSCGANGVDIATALGYTWAEVMFATPTFVAEHAHMTRTKRPWPLPSLSYFVKANSVLLATTEALSYLTVARGISVDVIDRQLIGWDPRRRWFLFPIVHYVTYPSLSDEPFAIVMNALWRPAEPFPDGTHKVCCWGGRHTSIYPAEPTTQWVCLCEGPLDALVMLSHGIPTVSGTLGAKGWEADWTPAFNGRDVVIAYDCDEAGRSGAAMVAAKLSVVARSVRVIDLAPDRDDGYDLTDWVRDGHTTDELKAMISAAAINSARKREGQS